MIGLAGEADLDGAARLSALVRDENREQLRARPQRDVVGTERDLIVAVLDGRVAGYVRLGLVEPAVARGWYLVGLVVDPARRRLGLGAQLVRAAADRARTSTRVLWSFHDVDDHVSAAPHQGLGFVEERRGRIDFPELPDGSRDVLLRLDLAAS